MNIIHAAAEGFAVLIFAPMLGLARLPVREILTITVAGTFGHGMFDFLVISLVVIIALKKAGFILSDKT
jgi:hypothetical protein